MPEIQCPTCSAVIATQDVNMTEGVALCRACNGLWNLRELTLSLLDAQADVAAKGEIPAGCWVSGQGDHVTVASRCRSKMGWANVVFAGVWTLLGVILLAGYLGAVSSNQDSQQSIEQPQSRAPGPEYKPKDESPIGLTILGMVMLPIVFGVLAFGVAYLYAVAALVLFGRVEISIRGRDAFVFAGVGRVGKKRAFLTRYVKSVRIADSGMEYDHRIIYQIEIQAEKKRVVGRFLKDSDRLWLCGMARKLLTPPK